MPVLLRCAGLDGYLFMAHDAQALGSGGVVPEQSFYVCGMRVMAADARNLPAGVRRVGFPFERMPVPEAETGHDVPARGLLVMARDAQFFDRRGEQRSCVRCMGIVAYGAAHCKGGMYDFFREHGLFVAALAQSRYLGR